MSTQSEFLLRPRGAGLAVADAFRVLRANLGPVITSMLIASLLVILMDALMPVLIQRLDIADDIQAGQKAQFGVFTGMKPEEMQKLNQELDRGALLKMQLYGGAMGVVDAALMMLFTAVVVWVIADWTLVGSGRTGKAWDFALSRLGALVGVALSGLAVMLVAVVAGSVLAGIGGAVAGILLRAQLATQASGAVMAIMAVALPLFAVPVLVASTYLMCLVPAAVVEQTGMFGSVARSFALVSGRFWRTLGSLALLMLVSVVPAGAVGGAMQAVHPSLAGSMGYVGAGLVLLIPKYVLTIGLGPVLYIGTILVYFSLRKEKDPGYGPEALAAELEHETATATAEAEEIGAPLPEGPLPPGLSGAQRDTTSAAPNGPLPPGLSGAQPDAPLPPGLSGAQPDTPPTAPEQ